MHKVIYFRQVYKNKQFAASYCKFTKMCKKLNLLDSVDSFESSITTFKNTSKVLEINTVCYIRKKQKMIVMNEASIIIRGLILIAEAGVRLG